MYTVWTSGFILLLLFTFLFFFLFSLTRLWMAGNLSGGYLQQMGLQSTVILRCTKLQNPLPNDLHSKELKRAIQVLLSVEFVRRTPNFSSRCFQWQLRGKGLVTRVRQTHSRLLRNSTPSASDPHLNISQYLWPHRSVAVRILYNWFKISKVLFNVVSFSMMKSVILKHKNPLKKESDNEVISCLILNYIYCNVNYSWHD